MASNLYVEYFLASDHATAATSAFMRFKAWVPFVVYLLAVPFLLVIGFDAFLVKYRMASAYIEEDSVTFMSLLGAFVFLFQMLGVVNLNMFIKDRLFIFIFGGD